MRKSLGPVLAAGAAVVLLVPGAAGAATKTVSAGPPLKSPPKGVPEYLDLTAYYPSKVKIAQGDSVKFTFAGFHNVLFRGKSAAPALVVPDVAKPVTGANDAAGAAFWFNGQPTLKINPAAAFPAGDKVIDKKSFDNSGLPLAEGPPPAYTAKFRRTGTFTYLCSVHPLMKGTVTVVKKGRKVPSKRSDAAAVAKQLAKDLKTAKQRDAFKGPAGNVVQMGNDTKRVSLLAYYPAAKTIKVGETVRFVMSSPSNEIHTATLGPEAYVKALADGFFGPDPSNPYAVPPVLVLNPTAAYPSDPPPAFPPYTGANHGNGFINTGILDPDSKSPQPKEAAITFTKAGTYTYYCLVHGAEMKGTVTVQ